MPVLRIYVRIEVKDKATPPTDFHYKASDLLAMETGSKSADSSTGNHRSKENVKAHTGQRQYSPISVETVEYTKGSTHSPASSKKVSIGKEPAERVSSPKERENEKKRDSPTDSLEVVPNASLVPSEGSVFQAVDKSEVRDNLGNKVSNSSTHPEHLEATGARNTSPCSGPRSVVSPAFASANREDHEIRPPSASFESANREGGDKSSSRGGSTTPGGSIPSVVQFRSGNPCVELTEGILHLYKESQTLPSPSEDESSLRSEMICILGVPATLNTHDLLVFTDHVYPGIEQLKIIRDRSPNQYMVLIKFRSQREADEFYTTYNNEPFNTIEPAVCCLAYVAKVEVQNESEGACFPIPGVTELPQCPVCLERMDESVDGILTILCNHSFHGYCLSKWGDTSCPVCRFCQTPEPVEDNQCMQCDSTESLWICLICGNVGCGRYNGGHAYEHFKVTSHTYAMQLSNNRVWDYVGDNYVHRLIQSKDGKPVEAGRSGIAGDECREAEEKVESLALEYTFLLTSQLDSQRQYFEKKLGTLEREAVEGREALEREGRMVSDKCQQLETGLTGVKKDKAACEKKISQLQSKLDSVSRKLDDESELNKSLLHYQKDWQVKVHVLEAQKSTCDKEIGELKDQLRDLMFYMEAREKFASPVEGVSREELDESLVTVGSTQKGRKDRRSGQGKK